MLVPISMPSETCGFAFPPLLSVNWLFVYPDVPEESKRPKPVLPLATFPMSVQFGQSIP